MTARLELSWYPDRRTTESFVIGDIRDVIYSRADRSRSLPAGVTHGLGLLSAGSPEGAGEAILLQGLAGLTPPTSKAGVRITASRDASSWKTPFFLAWNGRPAAQGKIFGTPSMSLLQIYEQVFEELRRADRESPFVFLEVWGLFALEELHDRALQAPVDRGDVLITTAERAQLYFRFGAVRDDLRERSLSQDLLLPFAVTGVGFEKGAGWAAEERFATAAFYDPPVFGKQEESPHSSVRTHSHAFGWRDRPELVTQLLCALEEPGAENPALPEGSPDYLVHLDEWTCTRGALVRVFLPDANRMSFLNPD